MVTECLQELVCLVDLRFRKKKVFSFSENGSVEAIRSAKERFGARPSVASRPYLAIWESLTSAPQIGAPHISRQSSVALTTKTSSALTLIVWYAVLMLQDNLLHALSCSVMTQLTLLCVHLLRTTL